MSFLETPRFPMALAYGTSGGPGYSTLVSESLAGKEARNINWSLPRHEYNAAGGVKSIPSLEAVINFFHAVAGKGYGFRFKDVMDWKSCAVASATLSTDQLIGTSDGVVTAYQLIKVYTEGAMSLTRNITKPVTSTTKISLNGVTQASGWTVDTATGIVTFSSSPASDTIIKAGYEFDVPVRFDVDKLMISVEALNSGTLNIPIREIKA